MSLEKFLEQIENTCCPNENIRFSWSHQNIGFGELYFYIEDGELYCDNEMMSKEFVKKLLCQMVDECTFTEEK
jgi:hypothetical protein